RLSVALVSTTCRPILSSVSRRPPTPTLLPYTTLFRSPDPLPVIPAHTNVIPAHAGIQGLCRPPRKARGFPLSRERRRTCRPPLRSEEHTSELQSRDNLVCRLQLDKNHAPIFITINRML